MNKKYKFNKSNRYVTRGINSDMPIEIQILLWSIIDKHVDSEVNTDYLQVFKFNQEDNQLLITHSQEQPEYSKQYKIKLEDNYKLLVGKTVYIIDDIDHSTLLFASEY